LTDPADAEMHLRITDITVPADAAKLSLTQTLTVPTDLYFGREFSYHRRYCPYRTTSAGRVIVSHIPLPAADVRDCQDDRRFCHSESPSTGN